MYILVLVLVPPSEERILQTVQHLLAPYDNWIEYPTDTPNPHGMWDSWRIGGDWDGWIQGKRRGDGRDNLGSEHEQLRYNTCVVSQLPFGLDFTEIVTPDGIWHSWYIKPNRDLFRKRSEREEIETLLKQYTDHIAVCVDCHF